MEVENEVDVKEVMDEQMEMQEVYKWVAKKLDGSWTGIRIGQGGCGVGGVDG